MTIKGLILAAGRGSRMGALSDGRPKCLMQLGARTLLQRQIESLREGGCAPIGAVTGYRAELVAPAVDHAFHNARWAETNMVASLCAAEDWLTRGAVIVSYSDIFYSPETVATLAAAPGPLAISYDRHWYCLWSERFADPLSDAETFKLDDAGRVTEIGARASAPAEIEGQYMGLLKFTPEVWPAIRSVLDDLSPERRDRLDMTSLLAALIRQDVPIFGTACRGLWGECDTESDLKIYAGWIEAGRIAP